jgi:hypothetical protein
MGPGPGRALGRAAGLGPCHPSAQGTLELPELSGTWLEFLEFRATSALKVPRRNYLNPQAPG